MFLLTELHHFYVIVVHNDTCKQMLSLVFIRIALMINIVLKYTYSKNIFFWKKEAFVFPVVGLIFKKKLPV
jgi:hypothetical protein